MNDNNNYHVPLSLLDIVYCYWGEILYIRVSVFICLPPSHPAVCDKVSCESECVLTKSHLYTKRMTFDVSTHAQYVNCESECVLTAWATAYANPHRIIILMTAIFHQ